MVKTPEEPRVLVVADDLTGANDAAVQFRELRLTAATLLERGFPALPPDIESGLNVMAVSTESRNLVPSRAKEAVETAVSEALDVFSPNVFFKKIDSTLRGNIEVEIVSMLTRVGEDMPVIMTPAYPSNGRTVSGGYAMVGGVPLSRTFAGRDTLAPVKNSKVSSVFSTLRQRVAEIGLSVLEKGEEATRDEIQKLVRSGRSVIVSDAVTDGDLYKVVRAGSSMGEQVVWAGSAGLARAVARVLAEKCSDLPQRYFTSGTVIRLGSSASTRPSLVLYGSLNPVSLAQVEHAGRKGRCQVVNAPADLDPMMTVAYINEVLGGRSEGSNIAVTSSHVRGQISSQETAGKVKSYFASVAENAVRSGLFSTLVLAGGDIARAVLSKIKASAISIEAEILPGIAFGRIWGGLAAGMGVVTKAGGFGDEEALVRILDWLVRHEV